MAPDRSLGSLAVFAYDPAVLDRFPATCGGVVLAVGVVNGAPSAALVERFAAEQEAVRTRLGEASLAELAQIAAWRRTFSGFGVEPTKYRNAAESLLRRLTKKGDVPNISTLVDIGNLVSIRYALPVAVLDSDQIGGSLTVRFATGDESFDDLGNTEADRPVAGEVVFVDGLGRVAARRWCWRQSRASAANETTTRTLLVVEAQHEGSRDQVAAAAADLAALTSEFAGAPAPSVTLLPRA